MFEAVCGKCLEWQCPCWFASLDLQKFSIGSNILVCLPLCSVQAGTVLAGTVLGSPNFRIERGIKQGDVISPLLFNAGLAHAIKKWRTRLGTHGIKISNDPSVERLTNVRFVDDLILYAKSLTEMGDAMALLQEELSRNWVVLEREENAHFLYRCTFVQI